MTRGHSHSDASSTSSIEDDVPQEAPQKVRKSPSLLEHPYPQSNASVKEQGSAALPDQATQLMSNTAQGAVAAAQSGKDLPQQHLRLASSTTSQVPHSEGDESQEIGMTQPAHAEDEEDEQLLVRSEVGGNPTDSVGGASGDDQNEGWDDQDPIAMLSESVQLQTQAAEHEESAQTHAAESQKSAQVVAAELAAEPQRLSHASLPDHALPETLQPDAEATDEQQGLQQNQNQIPQEKALTTDSLGCTSIADQQDILQSPLSTQHAAHFAANDARNGGPLMTLQEPTDFGANKTDSGLIGDDQSSHDSCGCNAEQHQKVWQESALLTSESSWTEVERVLGIGDQAINHCRVPGGSPFASTTVHGYPGIVFEVTQAGFIATVTLMPM